jgi:HPt (histidine-containing phosphotransfer) domain-containing protein
MDETLTRIGGDMDFLLEIASLFLEECPKQLAQIREAIIRNDADALSRTAHNLKGAIGNFGAPLAFAAAERLELMGRENNLAGAAEACEELTAAIERLHTALHALAEETVPSPA